MSVAVQQLTVCMRHMHGKPASSVHRHPRRYITKWKTSQNAETMGPINAETKMYLQQVTGDVKLSTSSADMFPWVFEEANSVFTITASPASIPEDVAVPAGCRVFLVWEGTTVKWAFGPADESAAKALWQLAKVIKLVQCNQLTQLRCVVDLFVFRGRQTLPHSHPHGLKR